MGGSALSRRVSEFAGVALFALALIWFVSLATYSSADPVWFFNTGGDIPPANFAGQIGAFIGELSYQLLGYSAYLIPLVLVVLGWNYFWCRSLDAAYTKLVGAIMLFSCVSAFLSLAFGTLEIAGKEFRAGGYIGDGLAAGSGHLPEPDRLDHPDPYAALSVDHPVDAVFIRAAVRRSSAG